MPQRPRRWSREERRLLEAIGVALVQAESWITGARTHLAALKQGGEVVEDRLVKTSFKKTKEQRGSVPSCTGALLEVVEVQKGVTGENSQTPGCRRYVPIFKVVEPKEIKGMQVRDNRIIIGTPEDPKAKNEETWQRQEGGPGRLVRLLTRAEVDPGSDPDDPWSDDEEWMEAAVGCQVVAPLRADPTGQFPTSVGLYFRPSDEDCPEIGLAPDDEDGGRGKKGKGAAAAGKALRRKASDDEDEDKPAAKAGRKASTEDDDEDAEPKKGKTAKGKKDEEEDEPKRKKAAKRKPADDEEEEDED